jgi:archaemetzincin
MSPVVTSPLQNSAVAQLKSTPKGCCSWHSGTMFHRLSPPCTRRLLLSGSASLVMSTALAGCVKRSAQGEVPEAKPGAGPAPTRRTDASNASRIERQTHSAGAAGSATAAPSPASKSVYLQPLGANLSESDLIYVESTLRLYFPFTIQRLPPEALPEHAYYAPRKRYRAERLLAQLEQQTPTDAQVIVGLTESDISTTKGAIYDWGILGLATLSGQQCVISRFRAKRGATSPIQIQERLAKTVVHEVGHTIGLPHCPNYGCIMEDGKGSVTTTDHERDVCNDCRALVGDLMLPVPTRLPW